MTDAPSSHLTDASIATRPHRLGRRAGHAERPSRTPRRFSPLAWLRGALFPAETGATLVPASSSFTGPVESRGQALRAAHRSLHALLKERPALRRLMPHLAHVERSLRRHGSRALLRLPANVLQRALDQLQTLQADEPRDALRTLRTRLLEAVSLRDVARSITSPAALDPGRRAPALEVRDASPSEFDEVERSWTGSMPLQPPSWDDPSKF